MEHAGEGASAVFGELAAKFQRFVDAVNDVSEMSHQHDQRDESRQYEIWLKTVVRGAGRASCAASVWIRCRSPGKTT